MKDIAVGDSEKPVAMPITQRDITRRMLSKILRMKRVIEQLEHERDEARLEAASAAAEANEHASALAACLRDQFGADQGLRDVVAIESLKVLLSHHFITGKPLADAARAAYQVADEFLEARDRVQVPATDPTKIS